MRVGDSAYTKFVRPGRIPASASCTDGYTNNEVFCQRRFKTGKTKVIHPNDGLGALSDILKGLGRFPGGYIGRMWRGGIAHPRGHGYRSIRR